MPEEISTRRATRKIFSFAKFTIDVDRGALRHAGVDVRLRPKSFEMLCYLVERQGRLISKDELLQSIWGQTVVTDDAVTQCLIDIRRAIGDTSQEMVCTVPRRGYIFDIPVTTSGPGKTGANTLSRIKILSDRPGWRLGVALVVLVGLSVLAWSLVNRAGVPPVGNEADAVTQQFSIAVLPFVDMSPEQDIGYFADGIAEELLNVLTQVSELRVIARTSSFMFKGQQVDIAMIRERLGVSHVLEGSVRKIGDDVRITAQLVDATTSEHIWSRTYDRKLDNVFAIQDEISVEVVNQLTSILRVPIPKRQNTDPEAYRLYLQAVHLLDQLEFRKNPEAELLMRQALQLDPGLAPAWRELGRILWRQIGDGPDIEDDIAETRSTLERARQIAPNDAATLAYTGWQMADFDGEIAQGARFFERALAIEPANENVIRTTILFALAFGSTQSAIDLGEYGIVNNPLCYPCYLQLATAYRNGNRLNDAEDTYRLIKTLFNFDYGDLGTILLLKGEPQPALELFARQADAITRLYGSALAMHDLGRPADSAAALAAYREATTGRSLWSLARAYAWTEQFDLAFETIDRAAKQEQLYVANRIVRWNQLRISQAARHPIFRRAHNDPRWQSFLDKYGISTGKLASVQFEVTLPR